MIRELRRKFAAASTSTLFVPLLFFPPRARAHLVACYRLLRAADDDVDAQPDVRAAEARARFWCDELDAARSGAAVTPVVQRCASTLGQGRTAEHLRAILQALPDQRRGGFRDLSELEAWALRQNGPLGTLVLEALGCEGAWTTDYVARVAVGFQLANIVKDLPDDQRSGIHLVPASEMRAAAVSARFAPRKEERTETALAARALAARSRELLEHARATVSSEHVPELAPVELWIELYLATLRYLEGVGFSNDRVPRHLPLLPKAWCVARWRLKRKKRIWKSRP